MKNNIGRKLTSLTLMTIMFAGGMTAAVPSIMPGIFAEGASSASGLVSISSAKIQGASILEIVIDDPAISALDTAIGVPSLVFSGGAQVALKPAQATDGKWYSYIVDDGQSTLANALNGLSFGTDCAATLTFADGATLAAAWAISTDICVQPYGPDAGEGLPANNGKCDNVAICTSVNAADELHNPSNEVLNDAPSLNRNSSANNGQIYATLNTTNAAGNQAWPYIEQVTMAGDNTITYGGEALAFEWGSTNSDISVALDPDTYADGADINLIITDPGLNIDPTELDKWVFGTLTGAATVARGFSNGTTGTSLTTLDTIGFGAASTVVLTDANTAFCTAATVEETGDATGVFVTPDANGASNCDTVAAPINHSIGTFAYGGESANINIKYNDGSISMGAGDAWMPAEAATVTIVDPDANRVNGYDEAMAMNVLNAAVAVPYIQMGTPLYLGGSDDGTAVAGYSAPTMSIQGEGAGAGGLCTTIASVQGEPGIYECTSTITVGATTIHTVDITADYSMAAMYNRTGTLVLNYDISSIYDALNASSMNIHISEPFVTAAHEAAANSGLMGVNITSGSADKVHSGAGQALIDCCEGDTGMFTTASGLQALANGNTEGVAFHFDLIHPSGVLAAGVYPFAVDVFNFNSTTGLANAIYRLEAEEDGTDGTFTGSVGYATMVHEGNSTNATGIITANTDEITILLAGDKTGTSAPRVNYGDKDESNTVSSIGAQLDANTHSGTVTFDATSYGTDSIVHVTVNDPDLNQDSGARESYSAMKGAATTGHTFDVSYNDTTYDFTAAHNVNLVETGDDTGVFVAMFKTTSSGNIGNDLKFTYFDRKDASGTSVDTYASVQVATELGSISFDRAVYPVPFVNEWLTTGDGTVVDDPFAQSPTPTAGGTHGNVTVYFTVTDGDYTGETIGDFADIVRIKLDGNVIATAGASAAASASGETGPLTEVERGTSVYEGSFSLDQTEIYFADSGATTANAITLSAGEGGNVTSGLVLQAIYVDQNDAGGATTSVYDSATLDLRTGSLSTDKEVYVIGQDFIVTITDPDLNLDSDSSEAYTAGMVEWDSSADSSELLSVSATFAANPSKFIETGSNTGVFQTVFTFPATVTNAIEQGEEVTLTYRDQGLSGKDEVKDDYADIEATIYASNFGAIVELDKAIYDWTDRVLITVTAPDHNKDSEKEESIGTTALPVKVSTRQETMPSGTTSYTLAESDEDTGVFTGEFVLQGFNDGNVFTTARTSTSSTGNTDGTIKTAGQTDGITVSYEYTDGSVSLASALIAWNIGEISFSDSSVSPGGSATITLIDGDLDTNPDVINTKTGAVYSDSDSGGIQITLHETGESTGVFETTVFFTADDKSTGSLLRVSEGDTVTVEYTDNTLPEPYEQSDSLTLAATTTVGTVYPPLERAPASNARVVDAFGSQVSEVSADQQVQIAADVSNGTGKDQSFAYLVQVQDGNGVTVSLAWITGALTSGQSMSPALSWTPSASGSYTATVFVWQSVDNPTALSPTVSVSIDVV